MLIIALQWVANKLAKIGLLPDFIVKRLGLLAAAGGGSRGAEQGKQEGCDAGCCVGGGGSRRRGKRSDTAATASSSSSSSSFESSIGDSNANETIDVVEHVTDLSRFQEINSACCTSDADNSSTLIIKFTAEWCKPCKSIQPTFLSLASIYGTSPTANANTTSKKKCIFITLDADGDDCDTICTQYKIVMMPTFICLKNGKEVGRMTGGGTENGKKLCDWVDEMCS